MRFTRPQLGPADPNIDWDFDYAVVRLGAVGLWLALNCHDAGYRVAAIDSSTFRLMSIAAGLVDLSPQDQEYLADAIDSPRFQLGADLRLIERARTVVVCVPTSRGGHLLPDQSDPATSRESILARLSDGQEILLASSTETGLTGDPWQWEHTPADNSFDRGICRGPRADRPAGSSSKGTK